MDDLTNKESAPNEGAVEPTTVSPASGQPSSAVAEGQASNQELLKRLERLEKLEQSAKDRAIDQLRKDFEAKFAEISGKPATSEKKEETVVPPSPGTTTAVQAIPEALARLKEVSLSVADSDIAELVGKVNNYPNREAFLLDVERAITRKTIKPEVSAAAVVSPPGTPIAEKSADELTSEYIEKMKAARGKPDLVRSIKAEYKQKGVQTDNVIFS